MSVPGSPKVLRFFRRVLQVRGWIVCAFVILTAAGIYGATRIPNDPAIDRLVAERSVVRAARNWAESDRLRDELSALGVAIKDNKDGTTSWEIKR